MAAVLPLETTRIKESFADTFLRWSPPPDPVVAPREPVRFRRLRRLLNTPTPLWVVTLAVFGAAAGIGTADHLGAPTSLVVGVAAALPLAYLRHDLLVAWRIAALCFVVTLPLTMDNASPLVGVIILVGLSLAVSVTYDRGVALWVWLTTAVATAILSPVDVLFFVLVGGALAIVTDAIRTRRLATSALHAEQEVSGLERARRVGIEERTRIARELHDVVAHHMSIVAVRAETAPYRVEGLTDELRDEFEEISQAARASLNEIRTLLGLLRSDDPARTPQPGLDQLDEMIEATRRAGVEVDLSVRGDRRLLRPAVELSAYRIIQESLSNVARHAPGSRAELWIEYGEQELGLVIANEWEGDGGQKGHGITGMIERAAAVNGTVEARRRPDGRFVVEATLPIERANDEP